MRPMFERKRMTVGELIDELMKYDRNLLAAGYSGRDEGDFPIEGVTETETDGERLVGFYNQGSSTFEDEPPQRVVVIWSER